ncbi:MAG: hypothetical protein ACXVP5_00760 [Tumebacillaceae bacterium]
MIENDFHLKGYEGDVAMITNRIQGMVKQLWGIGYYRDPEPILNCMEEILANWSYSADVDVVVTKWHGNGCHLYTKTLVKIGTKVYPIILSETSEDNVLAFTQNDITYLLAAVIEETEEELSRLIAEGAQITDPLTVMLQEMERYNDTYQEIRE